MENHNRPNITDDEFSQVMAVINEIADKSRRAPYIYRGESKNFPDVSSGLHRQPRSSDAATAQQELLEAAKRQFPHENEADLLANLQHYGGKTNLIDFTTDYHIALFFACNARHNHDGRVIFLARNAETEPYILTPRLPTERAAAQKSVFVEPPNGYIEPDDIVNVPKRVKGPMLNHLERAHGISTQTIYNDVHGFITARQMNLEQSQLMQNARDHLTAERFDEAIVSATAALDTNSQLTVAYAIRGIAYIRSSQYDEAIRDFNRAMQIAPDYLAARYNRGVAYHHKGEYDAAINDFTAVIAKEPEPASAYAHRGRTYYRKGEYGQAISDLLEAIRIDAEHERGQFIMARTAYAITGKAWLHLGEWEQAGENLNRAQELGADIVASFQSDYGNVADFRQATGLDMPPELSATLGG